MIDIGKMADRDIEWEELNEQIRCRLILIRILLCGDNQSEFARKLGIHPNRWNNYERGFYAPLRVLWLVAECSGISVSYIVEGYAGNRVTTADARRLAEVEKSTVIPQRTAPHQRGKKRSKRNGKKPVTSSKVVLTP